jgi:hypothetical protein
MNNFFSSGVQSSQFLRTFVAQGSMWVFCGMTPSASGSQKSSPAIYPSRCQTGAYYGSCLATGSWSATIQGKDWGPKDIKGYWSVIRQGIPWDYVCGSQNILKTTRPIPTWTEIQVIKAGIRRHYETATRSGEQKLN